MLTQVPIPVHRPSANGTVTPEVAMDLDSKAAPSTTGGVRTNSRLQRGDTRTAVIVYGPGQEKIVSIFADVLGKQFRLADSFQGVMAAEQELVLGISADSARIGMASRDRNAAVAIHAHNVELGMPPDTYLSTHCDYEFLYTETNFSRRDLARFISFTLGQISHHETLMAKPRTFFISTTFPDVRAALPNIEVLTVGCDAVELRVDLLQEPLRDGTFAPIPSLSYVGEQIMLLRQRTELPIIYTTRCIRENGRFPTDDPNLFYEYLYRAIQWGVEYIDVEVWLPEDIRRKLYERRGNSHIMSAFHDFSGTFKWSSPYAQSVFLDSCKYAHIVKMIAIINDPNDNFELEYFRSRIRAEYPTSPPFSGLNMGEAGQISRTFNKVFTPITHPLLPIIAAPGQMSAAEINATLTSLGQLPKTSIYGITTPSARIQVPHAPFYEKCFNELGLPHQFAVVERQPKGPLSAEAWCNQRSFGGAYLNPAVALTSLMRDSTFFSKLNNGTGPTLTEAVHMTGMVDTIVVQTSSVSSPGSAPASIPSSPHRRSESSSFNAVPNSAHAFPASSSLLFDNASWRGILSTLTRDLAPSAYFERTAVVLASNADDAASAMYALKALRVGKVYTVGFKTPLALARSFEVEPFNSLESLQRVRTTSDDAGPFVLISALGPEKSSLVGMLVRLFGGARGSSSQIRKVFLDLADGPRKGDPGTIAEQCGFVAYGVEDTTAFTTAETVRLLVGQNVPYSFASSACPYPATASPAAAPRWPGNGRFPRTRKRIVKGLVKDIVGLAWSTWSTLGHKRDLGTQVQYTYTRGICRGTTNHGTGQTYTNGTARVTGIEYEQRFGGATNALVLLTELAHKRRIHFMVYHYDLEQRGSIFVALLEGLVPSIARHSASVRVNEHELSPPKRPPSTRHVATPNQMQSVTPVLRSMSDAIPKKRGPKTDVLEALLKRVDGLEAQLKDQKKTLASSPTTEGPLSVKADEPDNNFEVPASSSTPSAPSGTSEPKPKRAALDTARTPESGSDGVLYSPAITHESPPSIRSDALLDTYFTRFHAKPYHILDESSIKQRLRLNQLPPYLVHAIYAVAARFTPHPTGYQSAVRLSEDFASMSRKEIDIDEPAIDSLQALLLLVIAYIAAGKGKKSYMLLTNATGMAMALELHREADTNASIAPLEREMRRRLFWSCYLLDRFLACGSKRPCLIADKTISLRLPCWFPTPGGLPVEGEFFQSGSNIHSLQGGGRKFQGGSGMLIDISRILGVTNRYLAAGGVRGDSHFPWHALSSLSKIRQDLDIWASGTEDVFSSLDTLLGHPECTVLVLSKLVYHLIYCLIYRPFLPIDLAELAVTGQHQSWQIEATNMCFLHANAITELVELGKQTGSTEWPAFVGYCICTAGTVHVHGTHYNRVGARGDTGAFAASADFLSREMQQLSELRYVWASVQHQRETLQNVYSVHAELVKRLATNSMRYSQAFNLEDFFSRYANVTGPGGELYSFDAAHLSLSDVVIDFTTDTYTGHDLYAPRDNSNGGERPNLKRKLTANFAINRPDLGSLTQFSSSMDSSMSVGPPVPSTSSRRFSIAAGPQNSPTMRAPTSIHSHPEAQIASQAQDPTADSSASLAPATPMFSATLTPPPHQMSNFVSHSTSSPRTFAAATQNTDNNSSAIGPGTFDPMFGTVPTNTFPSPAPWQAEDDNGEGATTTSTPGTKSHNGSTTTGAADETDPFLSLLEQLAENETVLGQGNELDFILTAAQG
ncbi:hypothetical protein NUW58_g238 [Xylaria curta]|uniref:Uncharacterized protein n=1 Tax=Xylaria curta TaxID=42375 RepID=A0ACC1PRD9_9PEZI|nr:hypothetical protein NUW58_g238 [Xylaria curta]